MQERRTIVALDFDGTLCEHRYPDIGKEVPLAFSWLLRLQDRARYVLHTMRSDSGKDGPVLSDALEWCQSRGLEFWGVNCNPEQAAWTSSPKTYAHVYIDDAALGCPLVRPVTGRPYVDWSVVGPMLEGFLDGRG